VVVEEVLQEPLAVRLVLVVEALVDFAQVSLPQEEEVRLNLLLILTRVLHTQLQ
jgi:hypothetical protein